MAGAAEIARQAYEAARRGDRQALRELVAEDATWEPAGRGDWHPCRDGGQIVETLLWRAAAANRLHPGETTELGNLAFLRLHGRRLDRLGARGLVPKLFQIVEVRDGKIVRMSDYARRDEALTAAGVRP